MKIFFLKCCVLCLFSKLLIYYCKQCYCEEEGKAATESLVCLLFFIQEIICLIIKSYKKKSIKKSMASNLSKFVFKNGSFLCHQENTFLLLNCYKNITTTTCVVQQKKQSTLKKQTCILLRKKQDLELGSQQSCQPSGNSSILILPTVGGENTLTHLKWAK